MRLRTLPRVALVVLAVFPVAVSAAGRPVSAAAPTDQSSVAEVPTWLPMLRAPATPEGWSPSPGSRFSWPLRGSITQPFGCTGFQLERQTQDCPAGFHTGIDVAEPQGTSIRAAGDGLAYPFGDLDRYGNHVIVQHLDGYTTVYAHLVRTNVTWGQAVQTGDVIGYVGTTGNSTGPHLHFEVRFAGIPLDPAPYIDGSPTDPGALPLGWPGAPPDDWRGPR